MGADLSRPTVADHIEELRRRVAVCLGVTVLAACLGWWQAARLIAWLKRPAGDSLPTLAFLGPADALTAHMKVGLVFGLICALPVILHQLWAFIRPGLQGAERRVGLWVIAWGTVLFGAGAAAAYSLVLPALLRFLLGFGGAQLQPVITINAYVSFALGVIVACGAVCELPVVLGGLVRLGVLRAETLRRRRGLAVLILVAGAAFVSPTTDAVSLLLCAGPLVLLYEASVLVARLVERR
jgi:sec-independent protein translocase protein TatC